LAKHEKDSPATRAVRTWRLEGAASAPAGPVDDAVAAEAALTLEVEGAGSFTLMCTPADVEALAAGFLLAEGLIDDADDIEAMAVRAGEAPAVAVRIAEPQRLAEGRNMIVSSSCGFCGSRTIDKALASARPAGDTLKVTPAELAQAMEQLSVAQEVFRATGGTHAAGIFAPGVGLLSAAEDIGRHNALDKAVGKCLLACRPTQGCAAVLSGRVSVEMVLKAARAGLELIAAVSAPSSLAVEAARRCNITLCGFVRPGRANVYTCPSRIVADAGS